jgi:hypothetical protein
MPWAGCEGGRKSRRGAACVSEELAALCALAGLGELRLFNCGLRALPAGMGALAGLRSHLQQLGGRVT